LGVLIRIGLIIGIFLASYLICIIVKKKESNTLLFLIMGIVSLLLSFIWNKEYSSFLQTWGIANLLVPLYKLPKSKLKKV
jgi:hypothetical protein